MNRDSDDSPPCGAVGEPSVRRVGKTPWWMVGGLILLVGCSMPGAPVDPSGTVEILAPAAGFSPHHPPEDWVVEGPTLGRLDIVNLDGVPALRIGPGERAVLLARRTRAFLLVSSYLSWAWNMEPQARGFHPVGLIVGFRGGVRDGTPLVPLATSLPSHDRALVLTWGESALQRGSMQTETNLAFAGMGPAPGYVVRGGRENAGIWWLDTVDLSALYADAWPGDDIGRARIVFVAIAATANAPVGAHVSGIMLAR